MSVQGLRFAALLKRYRRGAGLSQEALAQRASNSSGHISKLERSARIPSLAAIDMLTNHLRRSTCSPTPWRSMPLSEPP